MEHTSTPATQLMTYRGILGDRRLDGRADALVAALVATRTVSIAALAADWAEQIAFYRLLANDALTTERLAEGLTAWTATLPEGGDTGEGAPRRHLLLIQDTTEVSFEAHRGRIQPRSGLGWLSNNRTHGFCLHPTLVVDAQTEHALGFADVQAWARPTEVPPPAVPYRDRPIEQKESFRWITATHAAAARLGPDVALTIVADREADIYSLFARRATTDAVVRVCRDRRLAGGEKLYAHLSSRPVLGEQTVWLRGDLRRGDAAGRWARLEYRAAAVEITRPERSARPDADGQRDPCSLALWAVEIAERDAPAGTAPVLWRLLTSHDAGTFDASCRVCTWYRQRWHRAGVRPPEQVFRALKQDGLGLEASELETGTGLTRLGLLALGAALEVSRLLLAERGVSSGHIGDVFDTAEQACLAALNVQVEGTTAKQRNPHGATTLAWAAWVIARLGGWKGYASQHRAGPATYHRGLRRFHDLNAGWHLAHRDLYKP